MTILSIYPILTILFTILPHHCMAIHKDIESAFLALVVSCTIYCSARSKPKLNTKRGYTPPHPPPTQQTFFLIPGNIKDDFFYVTII